MEIKVKGENIIIDRNVYTKDDFITWVLEEIVEHNKKVKELTPEERKINAFSVCIANSPNYPFLEKKINDILEGKEKIHSDYQIREIADNIIKIKKCLSSFINIKGLKGCEDKKGRELLKCVKESI